MTYNIKKQISCMVQVFVMKCAQSAIDFLFSIKVTKSITLQLQTLTIIFLMSSKIYTDLE